MNEIIWNNSRSFKRFYYFYIFIFCILIIILIIALNYERYKFAVQVIIGERRDQGVR